MLFKLCLVMKSSYTGLSARQSVTKALGRWKSGYMDVKSTWKRVLRKPVHAEQSTISSALSLLGGAGLTLSLVYKTLPKVQCEVLRRTDDYKVKVQSEDTPDFCWTTFLKLLAPEFWYLFGAVISALVVAFANIQIPLQLGDVVNKLQEAASGHLSNYYQLIKGPAASLLSIYAIQSAFTFLYISLLSHSGERLAARMRKRLFDNIISQDIEFFDRNKTGAIIHRLTSDVQDFKSSFKACISQGLRSTTQIVGSTIALLYVSPSLTAVLITVVPSMVLSGWLIGTGLRKLSRRCQDQMSLATAVADEAVGNVRTVRSFAMEHQEMELFSKEVDKASKLNQRLGYAIGAFQGLTNLALNGMVLGVLVAGGSLVNDNRINAGHLMSFLVSTQTIQKSLQQLSLLYGYALKGMASGARVFEYMKLSPGLTIEDVGKKIPYHRLYGTVEFKDVHFTYKTRPEQEVIQGFNLKVPGGKVTALVGLSGSGKSTCAQLLERFYELDSGRISIDGVDISLCSPKWLRGRCIGAISQEPVLFATSVMENIRYGRPEATDAEVKEVAILANAHHFIEKFPDGYNTVLGERGQTVSGGQKQRIAIARALLKNPSIMILDEATSALDAESEKLVQEALDRAVKGRTVIVIAHRLSTIKNADVIAVLADGKVAEIGNHASLFKKKGLYWKLINHQHSGDII